MSNEPELKKWIADTIKDLSAAETVADASAILFSAAITMLACSGLSMPVIAKLLEKTLADLKEAIAKRTGIVQ